MLSDVLAIYICWLSKKWTFQKVILAKEGIKKMAQILLNVTPRNHQGTIPAGEIMRNIKFAAFWCAVLT